MSCRRREDIRAFSRAYCWTIVLGRGCSYNADLNTCRRALPYPSPILLVLEAWSSSHAPRLVSFIYVSSGCDSTPKITLCVEPFTRQRPRDTPHVLFLCWRRRWTLFFAKSRYLRSVHIDIFVHVAFRSILLAVAVRRTRRFVGHPRRCTKR